MIKKLTHIIFCTSLAALSFSQSLREADRLYENYEYTAAANIYAQYNSDNELIEADKERLAYCYYLIGDHQISNISTAIAAAKNIKKFKILDLHINKLLQIFEVKADCKLLNMENLEIVYQKIIKLLLMVPIIH